MCGIFGIWNRNGQPVAVERLQQANRLLAHRGPDGEGLWVDGDLGLAHRRLAIVDLSERAAQPFVSPDGRHWLLFNGEIHNYIEQRDELERLGEVFRSTSDVEVVLTAYRRWGNRCFERFNGMWAVAVWDRQERRLLLSRDRFGIKPLYYSTFGLSFVFSSEVKAIAAAFPEARVIDEAEVYAFLAGGSPDVGNRTFFRPVRSLLPGCHLTITSEQVGEPIPFWELSPAERSIESPEAEEEFRSLLADSVRLRMRSDVPVGVLLSGGLDSSSVARLALEQTASPLFCFSLRYPTHPTYDESDFTRLVADDPERYVVHWTAPDDTDLLNTMSRIVWHHDGPTPLRGRLAMWALLKEASHRVRVILVGEGGDELLAGYGHHVLPGLFDQIRADGWRTLFVPDRLSPLLRLIRDTHSSVARIPLSLARPLMRRFRLHPRRGPRNLISPEFSLNADEVSPLRFQHTWLRPDVDRPFGSCLNNSLWNDFRYAGLPELLHQGDALGMAFSLECRPPLLDHRLVEFCFSLEFGQKIRSGWTKSLLRRAMVHRLPKQVAARRDKKGMPTPYGPILGNRRSVGALGELMLDGELVRTGILWKPAVVRLVKRLQSPAMPFSTEVLGSLWRCATLEIWHRQFISGRSTEPNL